MDFRELQIMLNEHYIEKGFRDRFNAMPDSVFAHVAELGLICSECGEAMEAVRKGGNIGEECADIFIRLANFCNRNGIDLEAEVLKKDRKNRDRPYLHGDKL